MPGYRQDCLLDGPGGEGLNGLLARLDFSLQIEAVV
jgi:hypothetical protein